jgi:hypothetical protein
MAGVSHIKVPRPSPVFFSRCHVARQEDLNQNQFDDTSASWTSSLPGSTHDVELLLTDPTQWFGDLFVRATV